MEKIAIKIVEAVLDDMKGRCGIKHVLWAIDDDIYKEMVAELAAIVQQCLDAELNREEI